MSKTAINSKQRGGVAPELVLLLLGAFLVRMVLVAMTDGYVYDTNTFSAWAGLLADGGLKNFYTGGFFADYPPGYMLVLWLVGLATRALGLAALTPAALAVQCLVPVLCDLAIATVLYHIALPRFGTRAALVAAAFAALNPALIYDVAVWKQVDSVLTLCLLLLFFALQNKHFFVAAVWYGIALAVKPQALLYGPVFALAFLLPLITQPGWRAKCKAVLRAAGAAAVSVGVVLLISLPFTGNQTPFVWLLEKYFSTTSSYPYASLNAFNFITALGGNWQPQANQFLFLSWQHWGTVMLVLLTIAVFVLGFFAARSGRLNLPLLAAFYGIGVFLFAHRMHERYLLPAVVLLVGAWALDGDRRRLFAAAAFSAVLLVNMAMVQHNVGGDEFLQSTSSVLTARGLGFFAVATFCFLTYWVLQSIRGQVPDSMMPKPKAPPSDEPQKAQHFKVPAAGAASVPPKAQPFKASATATASVPPKAQPFKASAAASVSGPPKAQPFKASAAASVSGPPKAQPFKAPRTPAKTAASLIAPPPRFSKRDALALILLTLFAACLSLPYLGTTQVPQTAFTTTGSVSFSIGYDSPQQIASIWVYPGLGNGSVQVADTAGNVLAEQPLTGGTCFAWQVTDAFINEKALTITVTGGTVNEIVFVDADHKALTPTILPSGAAPLFDEAATLPVRPSQLNSMYFDEIYHGRTGFETLHGLPVYETTHPPLGKDLIAVGIALFGMNPFGWRIMGTLFGIAMVPVFYLLARRLFKRTWLATGVTALFALDFMRYTQSRIATIDVYVVFFVLLGAYFMVWFCQSFIPNGRHGALVPAALGGVAFGLGCASKWTGVYAGAGLALVYFAALLLRHKALASQPGTRLEKHETYRQDLSFALLAGLGFYVVVPLVVYLLSYLPLVLAPDNGFTIASILPAQQSMYSYHSQLTSTHPFESKWYTWPLLLRPVWYYMGSRLPDGIVASIAVLGNPVVFWGGAAAVVLQLLRTLRGKAKPAVWFVLALWAAQYLPWALITRATFLYHYFAAMPFALLALGLLLDSLAEHHPRAAKVTTVFLVVVAAALLAYFFPVLSGLPIPAAYATALKWLPGWGFYIV